MKKKSDQKKKKNKIKNKIRNQNYLHENLAHLIDINVLQVISQVLNNSHE